SSNQSDQKFTSRQNLIDFLTGTVGASPDALQYLGTFSRSLDQPSVWPDPTTGSNARPTVAGKSANYSSGAFASPDAGGNTAYGQDTPVSSTSVNPPFPQVLVTTSFTRNDGTTAVVGEPLVKKRFGLNRLAWLTYEGPSATVYANNPSDPIITAMLNEGIPLQMIEEGTPANILSYFGLTWSTFTTPNDGTSTTDCWVYNHGVAGTATKAIGQLSDVQGLGREADFFELLKAAITAGCLGKGAATNHNVATYAALSNTYVDVNQYELDTNADFQIFQIGANIMAQFSTDSYPPHIQYMGPSEAETTSRPWDFYGDKNLPYLYRARTLGIVTTANAGTLETVGITRISYGIDTALLLPEIWNPHDPNSNKASVGPTNFRFILAQGPTWSPTARAAATTCLVPEGHCRMYSGDIAISDTTNNTDGKGPFSTPVQLDTDPPAGGKGEIDFTSAEISAATNSTEPLFLGGLNTLNSPTNSCIGTPAGNSLSNVTDLANAGSAYPEEQYSGIYLGTYQNAWLLGQPPGDWAYAWNPPLVEGPSTPCTVLPLQTAQGYNSTNPTSADVLYLFVATSSSAGSQNQNLPTVVDYILQYQNPSGTWVTYQDNTANIPTTSAATTSRAGYNGYASSYTGPAQIMINDTGGRFCNTGDTISWMDPRTSRFGAFNAVSKTMYTSSFQWPTPTMSEFYFGASDRPGTDFGQGDDIVTPGTGMGSTAVAPTIGWYPGSWTVNSNEGNNLFVPAYYAENVTTTRAVGAPTPIYDSNYFADPDGVVRRGMSGYTTGSNSTIGLPLSTYSSTNNQNRPFILNRPFRSVAELGYTFSGTPWRNLDFFTPESGYASLLDVFCISETSDPNALVAGKVDLNTRQVPVIEALLSGTGGQGYAYKDEANAGQTGTTYSLSSTEAAAVAQAMVNRTTATTTSGEGPLRNVSELVGKWTSAVTVSSTPAAVSPFNIDGSKSYVGFSSDLVNNTNDLTHAFTDTSTLNIQRLRESAMRALSSGGQTRVWNLMIDLIAQTGIYKPSETNMDNFVVNGERRYWLHIAIDRFTGKILDEQIEQVNE
ncbi:MAG: hypothetical protein LV481_01380, partial [Methylacidiphilales bacterium]|nr:hypothetical protein [Candidatus Methylacidiphilales bacterium]